MPELPEVETVKRGLEDVALGRRLERLTLFRPDLRYPFPKDFAELVEGRELLAIRRRAKYLIFDFGDQGFLGHLGMSGSYRIAPKGIDYLKHDHFAMDFGEFQVIYHDPRRFGAVDGFRGDPFDHAWLQKLGVEPLGNAFDGAALYATLKSRKTPIKSALLNQQVVAGLGNIYVCEALWQAKISPMRRAERVIKREADALAIEIRDVLGRAIHSGGSTLRDYRNASGETGYFQHSFHVYGREEEECPRKCGSLIKRIAQSGRSTFYCSNCQI